MFLLPEETRQRPVSCSCFLTFHYLQESIKGWFHVPCEPDGVVGPLDISDEPGVRLKDAGRRELNREQQQIVGTKLLT